MCKKRLIYFVFLVLALTLCAQEKVKTVVDIKGQKLTIPGEVTRVAANGALNQTVLLLGGGDKIVATSVIVQGNPMFVKIYPGIMNIPAPFAADRKTVNIEELLSTHPQVVFGSYQDIASTGIIPVEVSLINPEEIKKTILLVGQILGEPEEMRAREFVAYYDSVTERIKGKTDTLSPQERPKVYLASGADGLRSEGRESIVDAWINVAGGRNIASGYMKGSKSMTQEDIVAENPDVIIAISTSVKESIIKNPQWSSIKAVQKGNVFVNPKGVYLWAVRSAEGVLQYFWAAKTIHPELFPDLDVEKETRDFYSRFYNYSLSGKEAREILEGGTP